MQGYGRFSFEDVLSRGREDCKALSELLGDHPFLAGDTPTEADCSLFGLLDVVCPPLGIVSVLQPVISRYP